METPQALPDALIIVVTPGRWNALGDLTSPRHMELLKILNEMGGIAESVQPGWYTFNVEDVLGLHIAHLDEYTPPE